MTVIGFLISLIAVLSGVCVVALRNPLFSAFSLIINLLAVAGLYAVLDAHFLAASQIMVYAGAVMVLVLFVLMLLNLKVESTRRIGAFQCAFLAIGAVVCLVIVVPILFAAFSGVTTVQLGDNAVASVGTVRNVGLELYQRFVLHFEMASLVIMVGVVGAVMLTNRRRVEFPSGSEVYEASKKPLGAPGTIEGSVGVGVKEAV